MRPLIGDGGALVSVGVLAKLIGGFDWLSDADKLKIFNGNPKAVFPQFARLDA